MSDSAGQEIVARVLAALAPDPDWCERAGDGFTWWASSVPLRVAIERDDRGPNVRVVAESTLATDVAGTGATFGALAEALAREPGLSTLRWNGESREVSLRSAVLARDGEAPDAAARLAHAALLQAGEAVRFSAQMSPVLGAPPRRATSDGRVRESPDELTEAWRAYASAGDAGAAREALAPAAMESIAARTPAPWRRARATTRGLDAELVARAEADAPVSLLRISTALAHPRLGRGLLVVLQPPPGTEAVEARAAATAAMLNEAESREWTGVDQQGGWCVHPGFGLVFATFVPATALAPGDDWRLVEQMAARARWLERFLGTIASLRRAE